MRGRLTCLLALGLVLAACGNDEVDPGAAAAEPVPSPPTEQELEEFRQRDRPPLEQGRVRVAVRQALERGEIGVVDVARRTSIRPRRLQFSGDASVEDVRWTRWDERGASGTGTLRYVDCDPNCAEGSVVEVPASVELSSPKACAGPRYYAAAEILAERGEQPISYVRAPC